MPLHFDPRSCPIWNDDATLDGEVLSKDAKSSIADTFIWQTIFIGMNQITEDTKEEFFARSHYYERLFGARMQNMVDGELVDLPITREMVDLMVGLTTNASPYTKAKFKNHMYECFMRELPKSKVSA